MKSLGRAGWRGCDLWYNGYMDRELGITQEHAPAEEELPKEIGDIEALEESPEVSLQDRSYMQIALARRMDMEQGEWKDLYSEDFDGSIKAQPELAAGFSKYEPEGKKALKALDDMIEILEEHGSRRKAA